MKKCEDCGKEKIQKRMKNTKIRNCKLLPDNRSCFEKALEGMEKLIKQYNITFLPVGEYDQNLDDSVLMKQRRSKKDD